MAITTVDGAIAGMEMPVDWMKTASAAQIAGRLYSPFYVAGYPAAAAAPSPGMTGEALTSYAGQLPFVNGSDDQYLARFSAQVNTSNAHGTMYLCDRLWHNSGIVVTQTTAQTINSVTLPARDVNGSTNGEGVRVGLEVSTITGAGASAHSLVYTNSGGTGTRAASPRVAYTAVSAAGTFYDYNLQAGDAGVRSIQTFTSSVSMTSGAVHLVMYRVIARVCCSQVFTEYAVDAITGGFPKLHDDTVPFLLWAPATTSSPTVLSGQFIQANG